MKPTRLYFETLRAYKNGFRTIVHKGGSRSGKTFAINQVNHFIADQSRIHRKISIISQTFGHLEDGAIYDMLVHFDLEGINHSRFHHQTKHFFRINKSIINYFSADNSGKVKGPARNISHLNEPNHGISYDVYNHLDIRTTECMILDYNPDSKFWLHNKGILDDPKTILIHSTFKDNLENLSKNQIDKFTRAYKLSFTDPYWAYWWKVYGLGEDAVLLEERIMPMLKWASKVPDDAIEIPAGIDFGWNPDPTAMVKAWVQKGELKDKIYVQELIYDTKLSINTKSEGQLNLVEILEQKQFNKNSLIIAECADPGAINEIRAAGFNIEAVKKQSVEVSIRVFHDYEWYIMEGSENAYNELDNYKYSKDQSGEISKTPAKGQSDHICDSLRYVLMSRNYRWSI